MNKLTLIVILLGLLLQSCTKDHDFATEIETQGTEEMVDIESDGTKLKGKVFDDPHVIEIVPQDVLNKLQRGEELTSEEKINIDKVSFERITYNNQSYSIDEAHADEGLKEVYFDKNTITLIVEKDIYLFDTEEEMEIFQVQLNTKINNSGSVRFKARFWEHTNFNGASLYYQVSSTTVNRIGFMLPSNWQNRTSSVKIWDAYIINRHPTTELKYKMIANDGRTITYPISYSSNYMQFSNFFNLYPLDDVWQWNADYNDRIIAFSIGIGSINSVYLTGGNNIFSLEGFVNFVIDQSLAGLQTALGGILFGTGNDDGTIVEAPHDVMMFQSVDYWENRIKIRSETDNTVYIEGIPSGTNRDEWIATNVVNHGVPQPLYHLMSARSNKVMDECGNCPANDRKIFQWTYNGGHNQHWVFVKYDRWWWSQPEYKIVNVWSGNHLTRINGDVKLVGKSSYGYDHNKQRWFIHDRG